MSRTERTPRDDPTPDQDFQRLVVLDGLIDALGVIVGATRRHVPAQHSVATANGFAVGALRSYSLCGLITGQVVPRDSADSELLMCVTCMNVAANLILTTEHIGGRLRARQRGNNRFERREFGSGVHNHRRRPVSA